MALPLRTPDHYDRLSSLLDCLSREGKLVYAIILFYGFQRHMN